MYGKRMRKRELAAMKLRSFKLQLRNIVSGAAMVLVSAEGQSPIKMVVIASSSHGKSFCVSYKAACGVAFRAIEELAEECNTPFKRFADEPLMHRLYFGGTRIGVPLEYEECLFIAALTDSGLSRATTVATA